VGHRVDDRLAHDIRRNLVRNGRLRAERPRADATVEYGQHEIGTPVHLLEEVAFEDLVGRGRPLDRRAMEMHATHLARGDEALWIAAEQQDGRHGGLGATEHVQVGEDVGSRPRARRPPAGAFGS
jgi:hypothetical protein